MFRNTEGVASCRIPNGSVQLPKLTVSMPIISSKASCSAACSINRLNWYTIAANFNEQFTNKAVLLKSTCPRPGIGSPQLGYTDARKLLLVFLSTESTEISYGQWFMSVYIPAVCKNACNSSQTSVTINSLKWKWGNSGFRDDLFIVCHTGYNKVTNRCNDVRGITMFQTDQSRVNRICKAASTTTSITSFTSVSSWTSTQRVSIYIWVSRICHKLL